MNPNYPMPRAKNKKRTCRLCKKSFKGTHAHILERDVATMEQFKNLNFSQTNNKLLVCLPCKDGIAKPRYVQDVKKRRTNSEVQKVNATQEWFNDKQRNKDIVNVKEGRESIHVVLDEMDKRDNPA